MKQNTWKFTVQMTYSCTTKALRDRIHAVESETSSDLPLAHKATVCIKLAQVKKNKLALISPIRFYNETQLIL